MAFELASTAFRPGETIPKQYTADGRNVSPPLSWSDPPAGTESVALICEDPDAPRRTFTHWLIFNLPADPHELGEGVPPGATLPDGSAQAANDFGKHDYDGPSPPPGKPHHYFFKLYALNRRLNLKPGVSKDQLVAAMKDHIVGETQLFGTYAR